MSDQPRREGEEPDGEEMDRRFREIVSGMEGLRAAQAPGMATDHRSYEPPEDPDEDRFVPPPPPPLPAGDLHFWGIVIGLAGGLLLLVLSAVVPVLPMWCATLGLAMALGGFVLLVLRAPRRREDRGDDWGAQV